MAETVLGQRVHNDDTVPASTPGTNARYIIPLTLVAVGIIVRTWQLGSWPALHGDEAAFGVMAIRAAAGDYANVFSIRPYQTPLYSYMLAPFIQLFGHTILAIRILPWAVGMFGIWSMYAAGCRMFGKLSGFYAAGTFAIIPMSVITMARIGWDAAMMPGLLAFATWMFIVALQDRSIPAAFAAGFALALASWFNIAAILTVPALITAIAVTGAWRRHTPMAMIAIVVAAAFSSPAYHVVTALTTPAGNPISTYEWAVGLSAKGHWATPWSLTLALENLTAVFAQWNGIVPAQHLLGRNIGINPIFARIINLVTTLAWLVVLYTCTRENRRLGQLLIWYVLAVFAVAHVADPAFLKFCDRSRYIVAMVPAVALIIALAARSHRQPSWPTRASLGIIFSVWALVSVIMLVLISNHVVHNMRMLTSEKADPRELAADYLTAHVDPQNDLVICQTWWTYFPIAYYSAEAFPMFSPDLHCAEMVPVTVPTAARRVWYVHLPWSDGPHFTGTRVAGWPDAADPTRELSISIVDDPLAAINWAATTYSTIINDKRDLFRRVSGSPY